MSENWKYQASPKIGDIMYNVRGETSQEFEANLLDFPFGAVAQFEASLKGATQVGQMSQPPQAQQPQHAAPQQQSPWGAPAAQQQAPQQQQPQQNYGGGPQNGTLHPTGQQCQACGSVVQYKAFTSKAGKDFKMWTCPNQRSKGDGHYSEFIK